MDGHETYPAPYSSDASQGDRSNAPNTIDQIRELLHGDTMRGHGRRVEDLQQSLDDLEKRVFHRIDELQGSIEALARTVRQDQSADLRKIGQTIMNMGREIAGLGEHHDRAHDQN